jgi:MinD-like ATPase involved in chromosome partitioning or flagellar assembly
MSYVLSWVGIKDGQGVTTSALAVAYELARRYHVLLIDADQSGTGTLIDLLEVDAGQHGMSRFAGTLPGITAAMLREETVQVRRHGNLFCLPGLNGVCGKPAHALAGELERGQALAQIPFHFVVIDWGSPFSHAGLDSPARAAEAICRLSERVFVQVLDSPALLTRAIRVLQQARPSRAELVLLETRRTELRREVRRALTSHLPHLELAATVRWDHRAAVEAEDRCTTMTGQGQHLVAALQLTERAMPVLRARPPRPSAAMQEG